MFNLILTVVGLFGSIASIVSLGIWILGRSGNANGRSGPTDNTGSNNTGPGPRPGPGRDGNRRTPYIQIVILIKVPGNPVEGVVNREN